MAEADCAWYKVREQIEAALSLVTVRGKAGPSCIVGHHFTIQKGKLCLGKELIDQEWVRHQQQILVKIMPKCVTAPPRLRTLQSTVDESMTEEERIGQLWIPQYYTERVGDEPTGNYVCRNCSCRGHTYRNCLWAKVEKKS